MTEQELVARAEHTVQAWNRHDVDSIVAAFSHDALFRDSAGPATLTGRQAVRVDAEALLRAFPDLQFDIRRTIVVGSVVVQEWIARGTSVRELPPAGVRVERAGIAVADYDRAGLICAFARYWNAAAPTAELGQSRPLKR